jgi:hypothetical protein
MTSPDLPRFSAASGALAGLLLAVPAFTGIFTGKNAAESFFIALSPALALPLLAAIWQQRHADVPGMLGPVAYAVNLVGLGLFGGAVFTKDMALVYLAKPVTDHLRHQPAFAALLASVAIFAVGSVLFGVFLLRGGACPRLLAWAYIVFPALLAALSPLADSPLKDAVHMLTGATLAWLALTVWRGQAGRAAAAAARQPSVAGRPAALRPGRPAPPGGYHVAGKRPRGATGGLRWGSSLTTREG